MGINYTHTSQLFSDFRAIPPGNYSSLIRFYEQHRSDLMTLPVEERFVIVCYYTNALFGLGGGQLHLEYVQQILEESIIYDIQYVDGIDIYTFMLYQKAVSHFRLQQFEVATQTALQLLRIAPNEKHHLQLAKRCLLSQRPTYTKVLFALGLTAFFFAAIVTIARILIVEPFFLQYEGAAWSLQILSFVVGILSLGLGVGLHRIKVKNKIETELTLAQKRQKSLE